MRSIILLGAALFSCVLSGCATRSVPEPPPSTAVMGIPVGTPNCSSTSDNGSCVIDIQVTDKGLSDCEITLVNANDDLIPIRPGSGNAFIYWRIVGSNPGYAFDEDDGIVFINNFRPRGFKSGRRDAQDSKVYRWTNLNRSRKIYAYVINVNNGSGGRDCFLDPWIRNR
jgi:hypothetical protein